MRSSLPLIGRLMVASAVLMIVSARPASASLVGPITFAAGQYDNTANTVTGTNAAPVYNNNQTTGLFRDVFWWGRAFNGGTVGVGSPDYINSGSNLVNSTGDARPLGNDTALNFTGQRTSGGTTFLSVYDRLTVAGKDLFDFSSGLTVSADVLFAVDGHAVAGGVVAMYNQGADGLALVARTGGGNNPDARELVLVYTYAGAPTVLSSLSFGAGGAQFVGDSIPCTNPVGPLPANCQNVGDHWYRLEMNIKVNGGTFDVIGNIYSHTDPESPNSALGSLIGTITLLNQSVAGNSLSNPGEVGLMATTNESFSDFVSTLPGCNAAQPCTDNVGVSFTNFTVDGAVPEPGTMVLLGTGLLVLARIRRRA